MKAKYGEILLLLGLTGLILLIAILSVGNMDPSGSGRRGSSHSSEWHGAKGLYLWLEALGYPVQRLERREFLLEPGDEVLWILAVESDRSSLNEAQVAEIERWVRGGGRLVWADDRPNPSLFERLGIPYDKEVEEIHFNPVVPWFQAEDATYYIYHYHFQPTQDSIPLLANEVGEAGAIRKRIGEGEVWLFATSMPFTNGGLEGERNSALVEGVLTQLPPDLTMTFDELDHRINPWSGRNDGGQQIGLLAFMRQTPWGWAIYYSAIVSALWLLLRGRAFGRPLALPGEHLRREAGEYVRSMAWLYRRAQQRGPILRHHHERLKRRLTAHYRLPPTESDEAFVRVLARYHQALDQQALLDHLRALHTPRPSDAQLLDLARANDEWLQRLQD